MIKVSFFFFQANHDISKRKNLTTKRDPTGVYCEYLQATQACHAYMSNTRIKFRCIKDYKTATQAIHSSILSLESKCVTT